MQLTCYNGEPTPNLHSLVRVECFNLLFQQLHSLNRDHGVFHLLHLVWLAVSPPRTLMVQYLNVHTQLVISNDHTWPMEIYILNVSISISLSFLT